MRSLCVSYNYAIYFGQKYSEKRSEEASECVRVEQVQPYDVDEVAVEGERGETRW